MSNNLNVPCPILCNELQVRRKRLAKLSKPKSLLLLYSGATSRKKNDVQHLFKADSNFYYLSGTAIAKAVFIIVVDANNQVSYAEMILPKQSDLEKIWQGGEIDTDFLAKQADINCVSFYENKTDLVVRFEQVFNQFQVNNLTFDFSQHTYWHKLVFKLHRQLQAKHRQGSLQLTGLFNLADNLAKLRMVKSDYEIEKIRQAATITAKAHLEALSYAKNCRNESELANFVQCQMLKLEANDLSFNSIVANGKNACTLHYEQNNQVIDDKGLILLDAGAEFDNYAGDVTSIIPPKAGFDDYQQAIYNAVLKVQQEIITLVKPNVSTFDLQQATQNKLSQQLIELGIVCFKQKCQLDADEKIAIIKKEILPKFYMHGVSHYIGLDVHDAGIYKPLNVTDSSINDAWQLKSNMVISIEPGLYFRQLERKKADFYILDNSKYIGIGIRIEDQILITKDGNENLTALLPREINQLEKIYNS